MNNTFGEGVATGVLLSVIVWIVLSVASYKPTTVEGSYVLNAWALCGPEMGVDYLEKETDGWYVRCISGRSEQLKK